MDGIIVINKEKGCTSHDVVYNVKKIFGEKVGHTGTLDPNATGILPVLIGKGTELSQFLINHDKKYIATIKLGVKTSTADVEGEVIEEKEVDLKLLSLDNVQNVLHQMVGKQIQTPPMYSAIKVNGKKLYEYARKGQTVDVPKREIEIYNITLININTAEKTIEFEVCCSKGTYIRSVCEDIAKKLNTIGYMKDLKRTMVGNFLIKDAVTITELKENANNKEFIKNKLISIEEFFKDEESIVLDEKEMRVFLNGVLISNNLQDGIVRVYNNSNEFVGIGINNDKNLKRKIIL